MSIRTSDKLFVGADLGSCAGHPNPDLWFRETSSRADYNMVKSICSNCPVSSECLDYAVQYYDLLGIWGGKTQGARREIARERGIRQKSMLYGHSSGVADTNFLV